MPLKIKRTRAADRAPKPARTIIISFLGVIIAGSLLLMLPCASRGSSLSPLTALFTATSATCVTGLTLIDPHLDLTIFGQVVLLLLIECGGLGLLTFVSFFMFSINKKAGLHSLQLARETSAAVDISNTRQLVKTIVAVSAAFQAAGALLLATSFVPKFGVRGWWISIFTSVSAYCNAGFDIMGFEGRYSSLTNYNGDPIVMYTVMLLIFFGGVGFIVFQDLFNYRKTRRLLLHTKAVLLISAALTLVGFVSFFALEYTNPSTLGALSFGEKINAALFQSVAARTAGFASIDMGSMHDISKVIYIFLMFIGAGSGSTGGGIKITTFGVIVATVISVILGRPETTILGRRVNRSTIYRAVAIVTLGMVAVLICAGVILLAQPDLSGVDGIFEAVSAFATVGTSTGVTQTLGIFAKLVVIVTMFIGRVGPISFVIAVTMKTQLNREQILPEGKIMVG